MSENVDRDRMLNKAKKLYSLYKDAAANDTKEAQAAKYMLDKLLEKYNISIEEFIEEKRKEFGFRWWSEYDKMLIQQIVYQLYGDKNRPEIYRYRGTRSKFTYMKLTNAEYIDIAERYDFYREALKKELNRIMQVTYSAFVQAQELYPPEDLLDKESSKDKSSYDDLAEMFAIARNMKQQKFAKKIENPQRMLDTQN